MIKKVPIALILIIIIAFFLRLFWLDRFPIGITNDELHFVLNAKTVWTNFSDISGKWNPFSFSPIPNEVSSEAIFLLISPIIGPLSLNLFNARLPFVLFNVGVCVLLYLITKKLVNEKSAFIVGIVAAINPWNILVARTSFDAPVALFFFFA